jgi:hypothetical protein
MTRAIILAIMLAFSASVIGAPAAAKQEKKQEVKKSPAKKAPAKKDDGKIKPLDPNRKVPTLKKKYKKED